MEKKFIFPENFLWGSATSGPQSEGRFNKKHDSVFDYWYDIEPDAFFDKVGPNVASNFYNSYKEDLAMIKEIGLNSFRTSIQWTRLIKDFETAEVDEDGVRFYNDMIDECLKNGLTPIMNLHHFDLPVELYKKYGGWESKHVVDLFVKFAEKAFELFGDRIKYWTTFNEPIVVVEGQYLYKFHYPCLVDGKKAPSYPRSESKEDLAAAKFADDFFNNSFLDPAIKGKFPEYLVEKLTEDKVLWEATEEEMAIIKNNTIDFLGVNYYQPRRVKAKEEAYDETLGWMPDKYFDNYIMPGRRMNPYRGWEIYPEAMHDIAMNLKNNYNNIPWYISENGMGVEGEDRYKNEDGIIEDDYRIDFIKEHLEHLHRGIEEGSNCFGYHTWTPIDCWSWLNAYKNRYGYISVDLDTQKKTIKKSGRWIKEVTENNGF